MYKFFWGIFFFIKRANIEKKLILLLSDKKYTKETCKQLNILFQSCFQPATVHLMILEIIANSQNVSRFPMLCIHQTRSSFIDILEPWVINVSSQTNQFTN